MVVSKFDFAVPVICARTGLTRKEAKTVIERLLEAMKDALLRYETLEIRKFGTFKVKKRKERYSRNLRTGERVYVPEHRSVVFVPGTVIKKRIRTVEGEKHEAAKA